MLCSLRIKVLAMSRIGKNTIIIPEGVTIDIQPSKIKVIGKLGELIQDYNEVEIKVNENILLITRPSEKKSVKSKHGLYRALIANMIEGVTNGFTKELELVGVGYRASNQGQKLDLALGFSHNILFVLLIKKLSTKTKAVIASTIGTALGKTQGSCLPFGSIITFSPFLLIVS